MTIHTTSFEAVWFRGRNLTGTDLANYHVADWQRRGYEVFWKHNEGVIKTDGRDGFGHCMLIYVRRQLTPTGGFHVEAVKCIPGLDYEACKRCSAFLVIPEFGVETVFLKLTKKAISERL